MPLEDLQKVRLDKLNDIKKLAVNPYPSKAHRTQTICQAREMMGQAVAVAGRLMSMRSHGNITFADVVDESGKLQLFFAEDMLGEDRYNLLPQLDIGDFIEASGEIFTTQAGEISLRVNEFKLLSKSLRPLPSAWYGLDDVEERYRQRYVDLLINPKVRQVMDIRQKVIWKLRQFMMDHGFIEVETPTLQPLYGGATAKPFVTHHNSLDIDLYLRISDELYLKRLIVGGFEKVFEICKDFRNEGIDRQHNPEFTMMEFYWAYADYEDLMNLTEEMISQVIKEIHGSYQFEYEGKTLDFTPPFKRISFTDLVKEFSGIDLNQIQSEDILLRTINERGINVNLEGVVGYGPLCDELYKKVARPHVEQPTFLVDYPYQMKPLSKRSEQDLTKSASFQLLVVGYELINAYNELNDPQEQRKRWMDQMDLAKEGLEEHQIVDEDYLRALEYGMPPTAGWGMGIDRFVSILTNQHNIKDVILFPTLRPEQKIMEQALTISSQTVEAKSLHDHDISQLTDNDNKKATDSFLPDRNNQHTLTREQAYELVTQMLQNRNLVKHSLAVEAIMRSLARRMRTMHPELPEFEFNEDEWGLVGLLHDADYALTGKDPSQHTHITADKIRFLGASERIINGIQGHYDQVKPNRENYLEKGIYCVDELSGLITAVTLVRPDKKLASVNVDSVMKKYKEKSFAAGALRHQIAACEEELGISLRDFIELGLHAMQEIADQLGL